MALCGIFGSVFVASLGRNMRRRDFIIFLGSATAWPIGARGQQAAMPVIGYLNSGSPESDLPRVTGLRQGLNETGYVEGRNVAIEYRWAGNQLDQLPSLAADLVNRRVAVIVAAGLPSALQAKSATTTIPIVFSVGSDPVRTGLVASLNRPGANLTGYNTLSGELGAKGIEVLHELVPGAATIGFLKNPRNSVAEFLTRDVLAVARARGLKIQILEAGTDREIEAAFVTLAEARTGALLVMNDFFFNSRLHQVVALAARYAIPVISAVREFAVAGGLMSYGPSLTGAYRQVGVYTGRILKGEKPADLPVQQSTKVELVINLKTAKALDLEIPPTLIARADELIE
jgi:putative ABC transport system substrate-binding protein